MGDHRLISGNTDFRKVPATPESIDNDPHGSFHMVSIKAHLEIDLIFIISETQRTAVIYNLVAVHPHL